MFIQVKYLVLLLCFFLISCHRHDLAPRDIEIADSENSKFSYQARVRYQRALNKLSQTGVLISHKNINKELRITVNGECRSLANNLYFKILPRTVILKHDRCRIIQLVNEDMTEVVPLEMCYIDNILMLDPDPLNKKYPFLFSSFYPSVAWKVAFPLTGIYTKGIASLRNASLRIQEK